MNRHVIILSGVPGAGKSTLLGRILNLCLVSHGEAPTVVSADDTQRRAAADRGLDYDNGGEGFDPKLVPLGHQECFRSFVSALQRSAPTIVVDNTTLSAWEAAPYVLAAETWGYTFVIVRVGTDQEPRAMYERNKHGVPYAVFRSSTGEVRVSHEFGAGAGPDEALVGGWATMYERFLKPDFLPWWDVTSAL